MLLHEKIKNYICNSGLKQNHIASKTGINEKILSAMLNGNRKITAEEYLVICSKGLGVSPNFFTNEFQENENMQNQQTA